MADDTLKHLKTCGWCLQVFSTEKHSRCPTCRRTEDMGAWAAAGSCWRCLDLEQANNEGIFESTGKIKTKGLFFTKTVKCPVCKGSGIDEKHL